MVGFCFFFPLHLEKKGRKRKEKKIEKEIKFDEKKNNKKNETKDSQLTLTYRSLAIFFILPTKVAV